MKEPEKGGVATRKGSKYPWKKKVTPRTGKAAKPKATPKAKESVAKPKAKTAPVKKNDKPKEAAKKVVTPKKPAVAKTEAKPKSPKIKKQQPVFISKSHSDFKKSASSDIVNQRMLSSVQNIAGDFSPEQREEIWDVLLKNKDLWYRWGVGNEQRLLDKLKDLTEQGVLKTTKDKFLPKSDVGHDAEREEIRDSILVKVHDSINKNNKLDESQKEYFKKEFHKATYFMPKKALDSISKDMKAYVFCKDVNSIGSSAYEYDLNESRRLSQIESEKDFFAKNQRHPDEKEKQKIKEETDTALDFFADLTGRTLENFTKKLKDTAGCYIQGTLFLNGKSDHLIDRPNPKYLEDKEDTGAHEIYAHELAHSIDNHLQLSSKNEWQEIWKNEIVDKGAITIYAKQKPSEGFAEFARFLYSPGFNHFQMERVMPKASKFFKDHGLWPTIKEEPEGGWDSDFNRDVFNKMIPLGEDGSHIDVKIKKS